IVLQHREAVATEPLIERLQAASGLVLKVVSNGLGIEQGSLYLAPAGVTVSVAPGGFVTRKANQQPGQRGSIDSFLISLASEFGDRAAAIVFSETGSDGTLGVAAIKEHGGLSLAELPASGSYDAVQAHLGKNAVELADIVVPVDQMAARIAAHLRS